MSEEEAQKHAEDLFSQGASYEKVEKETGLKYSVLRKLRSKWKDEKQRLASDADYAKNDKSQATFDVEEAPAPIKTKGVVEQALDSLKSGLGIQEKTATPTPLKKNAAGVKLTAKQQAFVESTSPTFALGFVTIATWAWGHVGQGYGKYLAPDENVALRIVSPLLRVYARHQTFLVEINPDMADIGASVFALVAYIHTSYALYEEIRENEKETGKVEHPRRNRRYEYAPSEDELDDTGDRRSYVRRRYRQDASTDSSDGRVENIVNFSHLSDEQTRQHEALLRLSQLDFNHRARRSGRFG